MEADTTYRRNARAPEDAVFYAIFPDISPDTPTDAALRDLHLRINEAVAPHVAGYVWQHEPFRLSPSNPKSCPCTDSEAGPPVPHLHGRTRYGDNVEDEWFVVFLLYEATRAVPSASARVWDSDGEFLLIEAAFSIPRWLEPDSSANRVFVRGGELHIVPRDRRLPRNPRLVDSLKALASPDVETRASEAVQAAVNRRLAGYPEKARSNVHNVRVRVPVPVAQVLRHEPCLVSLAVEGFYDRDVDSMKFASKMERFGGEETVRVSVRMSRAMYAQLMRQAFQAPRGYPMPSLKADGPDVYREAETGMKIACGFEMMYQQRKREGAEGKGKGWEAFLESLERSGYFEGLLPGSKEYKRRMEEALEYHRSTAFFAQTSETLSAPVRRIDEILALPHSVDDFKGLDLPPDDDDSWLYNGEDELNSAILERQKEMETYESERRKHQKSKDTKVSSEGSSEQVDDFNLGEITKTMQAFVQKVSSFEGAEVPENSDSKAVEFDVERFIRDMESVVGRVGHDGAAHPDNVDEDDLSTSDMDYDDFEDGSDLEETDETEDASKDVFMSSYSDALNKELNETTLKKSFIRATEHSNDDEGTSNASKDMDEDFTPVDVDVNLVKSFLDSFSSQQGLPGPASNLLGLMGVKLPQDASKVVNKGK
ncbi:hypothetical protein QJS04_geneDACA006517 [Acorus gramineus]|uniref:Uncharacterized protein n=1 Tax=Acorus gramineus TaxID=55184 RepID=A0AAV9AWJ5_ACOGR|nr:hypothetical protein QJS04_geneDACA006517 [Acorus gramineus]